MPKNSLIYCLFLLIYDIIYIRTKRNYRKERFIMASIRFNQDREITVIQISDFIDILNKNYPEVYISRRIDVCKDNNISHRTILSSIENIKEVDFDCNYDNEYCYLTKKEGKKLTIMNSEESDILLVTFKTLRENEDLIIVDSIKGYKGELPNTLRVSTTISTKVSFDDDINSLENRRKLKGLIGVTPLNILDMRNEAFTVKNYGNIDDILKIRLKFVENTTDLKSLDNSFYDRIKIRITDKNIVKFEDYIFAITDNNNCLVLDNKNKKE